MLTIVKSATESPANELIETATSTSEVFQTLLDNKYKPEYASIYQNKPSTTKQIDFVYIDDYYKEIKSLVQSLTYSLSLNPEEGINTLAQNFKSGLGERTQIKFSLEGITRYDQILE